MGQDPAFLFYPGDYLRDTQCLSEKSQVAYDRIMCEHMRNTPVSKKRLDFFMKRLDEIEKEEIFSVLEEVEGCFVIPWVCASIDKRRAYSESRRSNRRGKKEESHQNTSSRHHPHKEDENENEDGIKNGDKDGNKNGNGNSKESPNPACMHISGALTGAIKGYSPEAKISEGQIIAWSEEADRMVRLDNRTHIEILEKIKAVFKDPFWSKNIRSMGALRKQWNKGNLTGLKPQPTVHDRYAQNKAREGLLK